MLDFYINVLTSFRMKCFILMKLFYLINRDGIKVEEILWNASRLEKIVFFQRKKFCIRKFGVS